MTYLTFDLKKSKTNLKGRFYLCSMVFLSYSYAIETRLVIYIIKTLINQLKRLIIVIHALARQRPMHHSRGAWRVFWWSKIIDCCLI